MSKIDKTFMFENYTKEIKRLEAELSDLNGFIGFKNDEYIKQVGTWKIIQRLDSQVEELRRANEIMKMALEEISNAHSGQKVWFSYHQVEAKAKQALSEIEAIK